MSRMVIALTTLVCINIMLVLGGFSLSADITRLFYNIGDDNQIEGYTGSFNDSIPRSVLIAGQSEGGGEANPSDFRITDVPKMLFNMFVFLFDVMFAPIAIFSSPSLNLPMEIRLMLAAPIGIIMVFLGINWFRGND